jgi:hypothetical protein
MPALYIKYLACQLRTLDELWASCEYEMLHNYSYHLLPSNDSIICNYC